MTERLTICTPTYLRPEGLKRLLDAVDGLQPVDGIEVRMVIVDNDPERSAAWVDGRLVQGEPVVYAPEPRRGITFARNRALAEAAAIDSHWIAWLDDDEAPRPDWLTSIVGTQRRTGADVVSGPSEPIYEPDAERWIIETGAFERDRFETDAPYPFFHTRTSGVVHRADIVPDEGFDDRLALTGGEDRVFFTRIHRAGHEFRWDDGAVVDEWVPTSRVQIGWLVRRWFRTGVTRSLTLLYLDDPPWSRRLRRVAGGTLMAGSGLLTTVGAIPGGRSRVLAAFRRFLLGIGAAWGALGLGFEEYREVHGQ